MHEDIEELILLLLREGNAPDALELYREETGAGREQARRFLADLAITHGLQRHRRRWLPSAVFSGFRQLSGFLTS